jgi:hypothetical protein
MTATATGSLKCGMKRFWFDLPQSRPKRVTTGLVLQFMAEREVQVLGDMNGCWFSLWGRRIRLRFTEEILERPAWIECSRHHGLLATDCSRRLVTIRIGKGPAKTYDLSEHRLRLNSIKMAYNSNFSGVEAMTIRMGRLAVGARTEACRWRWKRIANRRRRRRSTGTKRRR